MTSKDQHGSRWTETQLKLAFHLYCQLPFGSLHSKNPRIKQLAEIIGRTPSSIAMKLVNFASLDPNIRNSGRKGLGNASQMDRKIWDEFHSNWEKLTEECESILPATALTKDAATTDSEQGDLDADYTGENVAATTQRRIGQSFFRNAVLASYQSKCCMSNTSIPQLLIASHIVPWRKDKKQRLNPRNGLCLSAIHDRAFDQGLVTVFPDMKIKVSKEIKKRVADSELVKSLADLDGKMIALPEKFYPSQEFLDWHNCHIFIGG